MKENNKNQKKYGFPEEEEIERVIKRVAQPGYRQINIGLRPDASELDKAKYEICQSISRYKRENKLSEEGLGQKIKISQEKLDDILFGRITGFSLDELISYTEKLNGHLKLKIDYDGEKISRRTN